MEKISLISCIGNIIIKLKSYISYLSILVFFNFKIGVFKKQIIENV